MSRAEMIRITTAGAFCTSSQLFGAVCIGCSGGTSLGASVMRSALPVFFPKLIVSTVASGSASNFVGEVGIAMMNSVVDIAGQNSILNPILENAASMLTCAARAYMNVCGKLESEGASEMRRKKIGITIFGVTTPAVDLSRVELERCGYGVLVFQAKGNGGRTMENFIAQK